MVAFATKIPRISSPAGVDSTKPSTLECSYSVSYHALGVVAHSVLYNFKTSKDNVTL